MHAPFRSLMPGTAARQSVLALTLATALSAGMAGAAADEPSQPYSIAEKHLFMDDHLKGLPGRATVLSYHFVKAGSFETPFDDRVVGRAHQQRRLVAVDPIVRFGDRDRQDVADGRAGPVTVASAK